MENYTQDTGIKCVGGDDEMAREGSVVIKETIYSMKLNYGKGLHKKERDRES